MVVVQNLLLTHRSKLPDIKVLLTKFKQGLNQSIKIIHFPFVHKTGEVNYFPYFPFETISSANFIASYPFNIPPLILKSLNLMDCLPNLQG